jgi:hypothetical protein
MFICDIMQYYHFPISFWHNKKNWSTSEDYKKSYALNDMELLPYFHTMAVNKSVLKKASFNVLTFCPLAPKMLKFNDFF